MLKIIMKEIQNDTGYKSGTLFRIILSLRFNKFRAYWVPKMLTLEHLSYYRPIFGFNIIIRDQKQFH